MGRNYRENVSIGVEEQFVDTYLTVETMNGVGIVVPVVNNIITLTFPEYAMMSWAMYSPIGIGLKDTTLIYKRSHRSCL